MLQLQVLTDRQLESRTSLGDTNLTIGSSSFEGTLPAPPSSNLTNGAILDTEEELAEAGSYIRSFWSMSRAMSEFSSPQAT